SVADVAPVSLVAVLSRVVVLAASGGTVTEASPRSTSVDGVVASTSLVLSLAPELAAASHSAQLWSWVLSRGGKPHVSGTEHASLLGVSQRALALKWVHSRVASHVTVQTPHRHANSPHVASLSHALSQ